jgi:hypothetical protein
MFERFRARLRGDRAVDHAQTKDELLQQQRAALRGPKARSDDGFSGPASDRSLVDEGRPRK